MDNKNPNLIRIRITITKQTYWWLCRICAMCGWGNKDIGRAVDKLVRGWRSEVESHEQRYAKPR